VRIDGPYKGRIIDADTKEPIEGAVVLVAWYKRFLGGGSEYYACNEGLTNKNGEFKIPGQGLMIMLNLVDIMPTVFKVGYSQLPICYWGHLSTCARDMVSFDDNYNVTIKLKKLTMDQRRKRSVLGPTDVPNKDEKLFEREADKETIELGRGVRYLYDWHNIEILKGHGTVVGPGVYKIDR